MPWNQASLSYESRESIMCLPYFSWYAILSFQSLRACISFLMISMIYEPRRTSLISLLMNIFHPSDSNRPTEPSSSFLLINYYAYWWRAKDPWFYLWNKRCLSCPVSSNKEAFSNEAPPCGPLCCNPIRSHTLCPDDPSPVHGRTLPAQGLQGTTHPCIGCILFLYYHCLAIRAEFLWICLPLRGTYVTCCMEEPLSNPENTTVHRVWGMRSSMPNRWMPARETGEWVLSLQPLPGYLFCNRRYRISATWRSLISSASPSRRPWYQARVHGSRFRYRKGHGVSWRIQYNCRFTPGSL